MKETKQNNRRDFLRTGGAALVAASLPLSLMGQEDDKEISEARDNAAGPVYLSGCGWNRNLPGVFGQACFAFEARAELGGTGVGTIRDDVHDEVNSQFQVTRARRTGRDRYRFQGEIVSSRSPQLIGHLVTIDAEYIGNGRARASIVIESPDDNLVVIAIIAVLIGMLLPAIQ